LSAAARNLNIRSTGSGVLLSMRLTSKSARDEIVGIEDFGGEAMLKARVRALPEAGRVNAALEKLIAKRLGMPPSKVKVAQGGKSRAKQVLVGRDAATLAASIVQRIAELNSPSFFEARCAHASG
jgi:uncharacterized protein (TIGR00251 family)